MLLRFGCSNFLSIRSFQEISFVASTQKESSEFLIDIPNQSEGALACTAIYGANASGKSNFLKSMKFMRELVTSSHIQLKPDQNIENEPFLLDDAASHEPSNFECDFIVGGVRYSYGFSIFRHNLKTEFLYAFPKGHKQVWFTRDEDQQNSFSFGKNLKGRNSLIAELTRSNSLFLSAAAQQNHEQLKAIYSFFSTDIYSNYNNMDFDLAMVPSLLEGARKRWILDFLIQADTGISDVRVITEPVSGLARELLSFIKEKTDKDKNTIFNFDDNSRQIKRIEFGHTGAHGKLVFLPFESESLGTKKILSLLKPVLSAIDEGGIAIIDEIDTSMHILVAMRMIELFKNSKINSKGAQLVFTTHDTNLLNCGQLRRDEIWFAEKNRVGETHLYPLSDFKTRSTDNLEKGYLQGRFGALPFMGALDDMPN